MKSFIVLALFVAAVAAAPAGPDADAVITRQETNSNIGDGSYSTLVETSNGIQSQEQGALKNVGTENEALEVRGSFSYPSPDGTIITVTYVANELGFQADGAHLPRA